MYVTSQAELKELPSGGRVDIGAFGAVRLCAVTWSQFSFVPSV